MLRSKSLDRNSYNSGDWFNRLDFTYQSNNWGVGLPPAGDNQANWPIMQPLLANPNLRPTSQDILRSLARFRELLEIRKSSRLFRLRTAAEINARLSFANGGPDQIPGLIVMRLSDRVEPDLDPNAEEIVVLFNANDEAQTVKLADTRGRRFKLHKSQRTSDDVVATDSRFVAGQGAFVVPARTTAVFVDPWAGFTASRATPVPAGRRPPGGNDVGSRGLFWASTRWKVRTQSRPVRTICPPAKAARHPSSF